MPLTIHLSEVVDEIITKVKGLAVFENRVYYGDVTMIAAFPTVTVEGESLNREFSGAMTRTDNNFRVFLMVYHARIADAHFTQRAADQMRETVVDLLHTDIRLNERVLSSIVTAQEPGIARMGNDLLRASRISWTGYNKTGLQG